MYRISKQISFCYGHRLLEHAGKCRHLHGHNARAVITLEAPDLGKVSNDVLIRYVRLGIDIRAKNSGVEFFTVQSRQELYGITTVIQPLSASGLRRDSCYTEADGIPDNYKLVIS